MAIYNVCFIEEAEIEAASEEEALAIAKEHVHIYAEDDAYYKIDLLEE